MAKATPKTATATAPKPTNKPATPAKPKSKPEEPVEQVEEVTEQVEETTEVEEEVSELPEPIDRSEIKYPKLVTVNKTADGEGNLTPDELKEIVGFTNDPITAKVNGFDETPLDHIGDEKVWFLYNTKNRPYNSATAHSYAQSMLTGKWEANGEAAQIGKTGEVLSLQHRGMGLLLAEHERAKNPEMWSHLWGDGPVTIPLILTFGVDETDRVVNTIDTGKTRSGSDMLFRTEFMVKAFENPSERKIAGNIVANAVRLLWDRMGVKAHSYAAQLNHAELFDFIQRHPKILEAAAHILKEDQFSDKKRGRITNNVLPAGYAAGVLFLMGASDTDHDTYNKVGTDEYKKVAPTQEAMDFSRWDKAIKFWSDLSNQNSTALAPVRMALETLKDKFLHRGLPEGMEPLKDDQGNPVEVEGSPVSNEEKLIVLAKAWALYKKGKPIKVDDILPEPDSVKYDSNRRRKIVGELPNFEGVDVPKVVKFNEPTPEDEEGQEGGEEGTEPEVQRTPQQEINNLRLQFGVEDGDVAFFNSSGSDTYRLWNPNTKDKELMKALGLNPNKPEEKTGAFAGLTKQEITKDKYDAAIAKAVAAGRKVFLIETFGKEKPPVCTPLTGKPVAAKPKVAPKK